jgi:hypothetical protein
MKTKKLSEVPVKSIPDLGAYLAYISNGVERLPLKALSDIQASWCNLLANSNDTTIFHEYIGSTLIKTSNIVVPEWGAIDANRVVSSGGSDVIKALEQMEYVPVGQVISLSIYMKNNSNENLLIRSNIGGRSATLAPGEQRRIKFENITGTGSAQAQFQIRTADVSGSVDFTWWRAQYQYGSVATAWFPALADLL